MYQLVHLGSIGECVSRLDQDKPYEFGVSVLLESIMDFI